PYYISQSHLNIKLSADSVKNLIAYQQIGSIIQGAAIEIGISISSVHCIIGKMNFSVIADHDIAYYNVLIRFPCSTQTIGSVRSAAQKHMATSHGRFVQEVNRQVQIVGVYLKIIP